MTSLDPKGFQAAIDALWNDDEPSISSREEVASLAIAAYLSASTTPSGEVEGLEVVAFRSKVEPDDEWDFTAIDPHCDTTDFAAVEPLVRLSEASTALASMKGEEERQWRPIETAPRDGTWLSVFCPSYVHDAVRPAQFIHDVGLGEDIWQYAGEGYEYPHGPEAPTHWQPLPTPPSQALGRK